MLLLLHNSVILADLLTVNRLKCISHFGVCFFFGVASDFSFEAVASAWSPVSSSSLTSMTSGMTFKPE